MDLIVEIFLTILLCVAIVYGFILNRKLIELKKGQQGLEKLAHNFAQSTGKAEASVTQLKVATSSASKFLDEASTKAVSIREDLMFLIDRGDKLADNLESAIRSNEKNDTKLAEYEEGVNVDMSHLTAPKKKQKYLGTGVFESFASSSLVLKIVVGIHE